MAAAADTEEVNALKQALDRIDLTEETDGYGEGGYVAYTAARDSEWIAQDLLRALDALGYKVVRK